MTKYSLRIYILITLLATQACKKHSNPKEPILASAKELVREIKWPTLGSRAELLYNNDSTLKTINYFGSGSGYAVNYIYNQKRLASFGLGNSIYQHDFLWIGNRISNIKRMELQGRGYTQDLEFTYNANGTVSMLKYYQINEAGRFLTATNTYHYDANQRLSEITSVDKNGSKSSILVEAYSAEFNYDPLWFTGISIAENYQLYNYPVLSTMKGMPSKIRRIQYVNGQPSTEQIILITFVISNKRIDKQTAVSDYLQHPQYNTSTVTEFIY